jgi:hypothetical protein
MINSRQGAELPKPPEPAIKFSDNAFLVDAELIGELLRVPASRVPVLMREGKITSACERGVGEHAGEFRLSFFYRNRRARLGTDLKGQVLRKSAVDFGDRPMPDAPNRAIATDADPVDLQQR